MKKDKHKANRKCCPKCDNIMGENIEGKPICGCENRVKYEENQSVKTN